MLNLMEEFEFSGEWWLPTNEDKRVPGTLRFSQMEGAVLILMGNFHSMLEFNNPIEANVILGLTTTGKSVTLLRCWQIKTNIGFTNSGSSEYIAGFVIVGAHFSDVEDMKFKRFRVSYSYLDEWVGISGFEIGDDLSKEIDIKYKLPASIDISEIDGVKLGIVFGWQLDSIMRNQTSISVNQNIFVVFNFPKGRGFFEVLDFIGHLENFLTLGIGEYARPIYLQGESENYKRVTGGENIYEPIDILYQYVGIPSPKKNLLDIQMLFSYHDIEDRIGDLIQNWYSKKDLLEPVYSLYFSTLKERQMYINHYFMNLVQGIEIYHRRIIRNEELPPVEHKKRIKEVMKKSLSSIKIGLGAG